MDIRSIQEKAFRAIQSDPELYRLWCDAKSQQDRDAMMAEQVYHIGYAAAVSDSMKYRRA